MADDYAVFANRLASFATAQPAGKRRTSAAKKKAGGWPHVKPTPDELARAGFVYKPLPDSDDNVTCFLCDKDLDGWESGDNPAAEHLAHVPECGWAINVGIEQRSQDEGRAEEDPMNEKMVQSRLSTFRDVWPHDGRKGWKCKTQKMVNAGWCYTPLPEADDCVHCFYCGVSLDGWEPKDDPLEEHRRRAPECHFFTLVDMTKKKRVSKGRTSTQSVDVSMVSEDGEKRKRKPAEKKKRGRPKKEVEVKIDEEIVAATQEPEVVAAEPVVAVEVQSVTPQPKRGQKRASEGQQSPPKRLKSPSPASDEENVPPSSKPSQKLSTPQPSPSKRFVTLASANRWTQADIETVFFTTPSTRKILAEQNIDILNRVSTPEKQMSVEEWIMHNARNAEQQLKNECERLIGVFETEGNRALGCLEGVEAL